MGPQGNTGNTGNTGATGPAGDVSAATAIATATATTVATSVATSVASGICATLQAQISIIDGQIVIINGEITTINGEITTINNEILTLQTKTQFLTSDGLTSSFSSALGTTTLNAVDVVVSDNVTVTNNVNCTKVSCLNIESANALLNIGDNIQCTTLNIGNSAANTNVLGNLNVDKIESIATTMNICDNTTTTIINVGNSTSTTNLNGTIDVNTLNCYGTINTSQVQSDNYNFSSPTLTNQVMNIGASPTGSLLSSNTINIGSGYDNINLYGQVNFMFGASNQPISLNNFFNQI
jgi:hypothetical protein